VGEVLGICTRTWRRLGVPRADIEAMQAELLDDLEAAYADGVDPQAYVGGDAAGLARAWASARGLVRPRYRVIGCALVALAVIVPMMFAASFLYVATTSAYVADLLQPGWDWNEVPAPPELGDGYPRPFVSWPLWLFVGWYVAAAFAGMAFVLLAVSAYLRIWADPGRRATVRALAVAFLPLAALSGFVVAGVSKALAGHSGTLAGQIAQYSAFALSMAVGVGAVRALTVAWLRRRRHQDGPAPEPAYA
jgi:hypothetical protein